MYVTLQAEEAAITAIAIYFLTKHRLGLPFWLWIPLFLSPDTPCWVTCSTTVWVHLLINLFHHRAVGLFVVAAGFLLHQEVMINVGILLFAHSSFDRMLGYGLKYSDSFNHTSLGWMGKREPRQ